MNSSTGPSIATPGEVPVFCVGRSAFIEHTSLPRKAEVIEFETFRKRPMKNKLKFIKSTAIISLAKASFIAYPFNRNIVAKPIMTKTRTNPTFVNPKVIRKPVPTTPLASAPQFRAKRPPANTRPNHRINETATPISSILNQTARRESIKLSAPPNTIEIPAPIGMLSGAQSSTASTRLART